MKFTFTNAAAQTWGRIVQMNNHFGRGDVVYVDFYTCVFTRYIPVSQGNGFLEQRKFRMRDETVFCLGHQSKYTVPMKM